MKRVSVCSHQIYMVYNVEGGKDRNKYTKSQELCFPFPPHLCDNHDTRIIVSTLMKKAERVRSLTKMVGPHFSPNAHALPQEEELPPPCSAVCSLLPQALWARNIDASV